MGDKLLKPTIIKEDTKTKKDFEQLRNLKGTLNYKGEKLLSDEIKKIKYGIDGEKNILYELKNSDIPMYILHGLNLTYDDMSSQIDFMVFTKKICFIIECKNMYGNIVIKEDGSFVRVTDYNEKGMYSPITQNEKHLNLIKKIKIKNQSFFSQLLNRDYSTRYHDIVVLANPETILDSQDAKPEIKRKVLRADQLNKYISETCSSSNLIQLNEKELKAWVDSIVYKHKEKSNSYIKKYDSYKLQTVNNSGYRNNDFSAKNKVVHTYDTKHRKDTINTSDNNVNKTKVYQALVDYRLKKSKEEGLKAFMVFNNKQLEELIAKRPDTLKELLEVSGFGEVKAKKYGLDLIKILENHI